MTILDEIFEYKRKEVALRKLRKPLDELTHEASLAAPALDFVSAIRDRSVGREGVPALIAEIKRASPSRGELAVQQAPLELAEIYQQNGAAAISVLTDERYFKGSLDYLKEISSANLGLPLLRKDFIYDPYQVVEARSAGADAVLLIAAALDVVPLYELHEKIRLSGMTPLVEVHNEQELEAVLRCDPLMVGVNNRDLRDFSVNLETTFRLRNLIPEHVCLVSESGIHTPEDVLSLAQAGVDAVLVGEALVTAADTAAKVRSLTWCE